MIVLLLVYAVVQGSFGDATPTPWIELRDLGSGGEPIQTRSLWNIIWSCLSTIFLCTWVSLHPNISSTPKKPGLGWFEKWIRNPLIEFLTYKLPLFLWALLVPEYILAWAIRQYIMAGEVQKRGVFIVDPVINLLSIVAVPGWTRSHDFFLIMRGFQQFERTGQPPQLISERNEHATHAIGRFVRILHFKDVFRYRLERSIPFVTEEEIKDKGKSDTLSKFIVLLQTSWFITQCIARGIKHLPLTELEIVTLAYAMLNLFVYIFWWDKPHNVGCPIRVYENLTSRDDTAETWETGFVGIVEQLLTYVLGMQDKYVVRSRKRKVPMFWSGCAGYSSSEDTVSIRASLGPSVLGIAFGAIHFVAWSYVFPSHAELVLWRTSSIVMMIVPLLSAIVCSAGMTGDESTLFRIIGPPCTALLALSSWLYIVARVATIVMGFTTLRSLPSEASIVVDWTAFIPHI